MGVCRCGFCNLWVCVCVGFFNVCIVGFVILDCGFFNVWVCVCVTFVMCECVCVCVCGFSDV